MRLWSPRARRAWLVALVTIAAGCGVQARSASSGDAAPAPAPAPADPVAGHALSARPAFARGRTPPQLASQRGTRDYEYVFVDGEAYVYDVGRGQRLVQTISLPGITSIRGVGMDLRDRLLYISYGGDGGSDGTGSLAAYDPVAGRIVWNVAYPHGVDSFAIASDGARIYLPEGERAPGGRWWVIDAANGSTLGSITAGVGPHNTVVGISGSRVYLGPRNTPYLYVASTRTDRVIRRLGPLYSGVRPFTINGRETLAYTTATGLLGFQVSSIATGRVLYTEAFGGRFRWDPATWPLTAPSHGISLSPDDRHLFVIDTPNAYVHVFDVSGLPRHAPRQIANVRLSHSFAGQQAQCSQDCERDGWLQSSLNGCYVYVGDSGDVISATTYRRVGYLPALRNSRETVEIDWRGDVPVATSTKSGLGYATGRSRPPRPRCR